MQQLQPQGQTIDVESYSNEIQVVFSQVYLLMTLGLVITALVAAWIAGSPRIVNSLFSNWWGPLILFGVQIGLVIGLTAAVYKLAPSVAVALFIGYSALTGVTLSLIFLIYTDASIATTFLITAGTFGAMSLFGFVTRRDLTKMGSLLIMLLLGLVLASVVNIFLNSPAIYWIITFAGIGIFVGLIAYDTQKIKRMAASGMASGKARSALAIMGALALYLDFINLFLMLLRLFGRRR
jgi:FtsH-binding integral membrane protein